MKTARFRFSTSLLIRLGEELNPTLDHGLLELAKNAYDADAKTCTIEFADSTNTNARIIVSDDGNGMNAQDVADSWLVVGQSRKKSNQVTTLGRTPAGDKGLGRLAALRLGRQVTLTSIPKKNRRVEVAITIDWDALESAQIVDDVQLTIHSRKLSKPGKHGTRIEITNLRASVQRMEVKRLARALLLLADPFSDSQKGFSPKLMAPEFEDLSAQVAKRYFEDAEYRLVAKVEKDGTATAKVTDWKGKTLFSADQTHLVGNSKNDRYACPPLSFEFWVFILSKTAFSAHNSTATLGEIKDWLSQFGGIHIYYSGLRVLPYGEPADDWVGINIMRAKGPEERPSTNTSLGRVIIENPTDQLIQKTDRSGFIENETFHEIKRFTQDSLQWMAKRRLEIAEKRRAESRTEAPKKTAKAKEAIEGAIAKLPIKQRQAIEPAYKKYDSTREKENEKLKREVQLYRTLSTAGITAAVFAHDSPLKVMNDSVHTIQRRSKNADPALYESKLAKPVERIVKSIQSMRTLGNVTLSLLDSQKRRPSKISIHQTINEVVALYEAFLSSRETTVIRQYCSGQPYLRGSIAAFESIVANLLNNSLSVFESKGTISRKIKIETSVAETMLTMRVSDSGPGIQGIDIRHIWLPGETTTPNGTGLGLTIVRDAVSDLSGHVSAAPASELGGAEFTIELPIIGIDP